MFEIIESGMNLRRSTIAEADSFDAAKAVVNAMGVAFIEDDADHAGCADALTNDGRIIAVQPKGFKA